MFISIVSSSIGCVIRTRATFKKVVSNCNENCEILELISNSLKHELVYAARLSNWSIKPSEFSPFIKSVRRSGFHLYFQFTGDPLTSVECASRFSNVHVFSNIYSIKQLSERELGSCTLNDVIH